MNVKSLIKTKGIVIRQMENKIEEVVEAKVEQVLEAKKEEIAEAVKKVDESLDNAADKVEDVVESVISNVEHVVPGGAKVVEAIDSALVGVAVSCGCLGWKFSVEKTARKTSK